MKLLLLVFLCASLCLAQSGGYFGLKELRRYTRDLPRIDKVELLKLESKGDIWNGKIEATKTLTGKEAEDLAALWRRQVYRSRQVACHLPAYGIRFYAGDKQILQATLCWECNNIAFQTPKVEGTQYFDGHEKLGQQLLAVFRGNFYEPTNYRDRH